jgi:hypothetical protein
MAYQVRTTTSYGNRLVGSLKGIVAGFILLFVGTIMLCLNEGNYVKTDKAIRSAQKELINVNDISTLNPSLEGKLIHASAFADTKDILSDELFGVSETAVALIRSVEYYQFIENSYTEKRDKVGGGQETITTYRYNEKWVSSPVNSAKFNDPDYKKSNIVLENEIKFQIQRAGNVSFGAYKLPEFIIESIEGNVPADAKINSGALAKWNSREASNARDIGYKTDGASALTHVNGNTVYFGKSPAAPQIGDVRVTLYKIPPADISIIAKVIGVTFEKYIAPNGKTFTSIMMGTVSAETMIESAKKTNSLFTWILRFVGLFLIVFAFKLIFDILPTLFKVLPPLGALVGVGVGLVCSVGGFVWTLAVISLAWLFYRPLVGVPLLIAAGAGIWFLAKKSKEKKASASLSTANTSADGNPPT